MAKAQGVYKEIRYKKETGAWGALESTSGGQKQRRVTGDISPTADNYQSNEINTTFQVRDSRQGVKGCEGSLNGELSPSSYADWLGSLLTRNFTAETGTASASITIAAAGSDFTITRSAGSFLTDGIKVGQVIRMTGAGLNAANVGNNCLILTMTATVLTVKVLSSTALVAEGPIAAVAVVQAGKTTYIPQTGHTNDSYNIEQWFADVGQSEVYTGVKIGSASVQLPTTGYATVDFSMMGKGLMDTDTTAYFTSPAAATTTGLLTLVQGALVINGSTTVCVTDANISIERAMEPAQCATSQYNSEIFVGKFNVSGSLSAYFEDASLRDYFINETDVALVLALTTGNSKTADFVTFTLPKIRLTSYSAADNETGILLSIDFTALENAVTSAGLVNSTIMIQDSAAA